MPVIRVMQISGILPISFVHQFSPNDSWASIALLLLEPHPIAASAAHLRVARDCPLKTPLGPKVELKN